MKKQFILNNLLAFICIFSLQSETFTDGILDEKKSKKEETVSSSINDMLQAQRLESLDILIGFGPFDQTAASFDFFLVGPGNSENRFLGSNDQSLSTEFNSIRVTPGIYELWTKVTRTTGIIIDPANPFIQIRSHGALDQKVFQSVVTRNIVNLRVGDMILLLRFVVE